MLDGGLGRELRFRGVNILQTIWSAGALMTVSLAAAEAVEELGIQGVVGIKWPNDILVDGCKLAGILVESQARGASDTVVITGIGINVRMGSTGTEQANAAIDRPWVDLESCLPAPLRPVDRNRLVSGLLDRLLAAFGRFEQSGFASFRPRYEALDLLEGRAEIGQGGGNVALSDKPRLDGVLQKCTRCDILLLPQFDVPVINRTAVDQSVELIQHKGLGRVSRRQREAQLSRTIKQDRELDMVLVAVC